MSRSRSVLQGKSLTSPRFDLTCPDAQSQVPPRSLSEDRAWHLSAADHLAKNSSATSRTLSLSKAPSTTDGGSGHRSPTGWKMEWASFWAGIEFAQAGCLEPTGIGTRSKGGAPQEDSLVAVESKKKNAPHRLTNRCGACARQPLSVQGLFRREAFAGGRQQFPANPYRAEPS